MQAKLENISKSFGNTTILDGISLEFEDGKFYGLLGPNGAGKSTLVNIMLGLLKSDTGTITYYKDDGSAMNYMEMREHLGVVYQYGVLDPFLTVHENLISRAMLYGKTKKEAQEVVDEIDRFMLIKHLYDRKYDFLSGGQKRTVDIARALVSDPKLLILDEPTTGIDVKSRQEMWEAINKIREHKKLTVILISHYLEEMFSADWLYVLLSKKIMYSGTLNDFIVKNERKMIQMISGKQQEMESFLTGQGVEIETVNAEETQVFYDNAKTKMGLMSELLKMGLVSDFYATRPTLDSAYLQLLKKGGHND
jgi:multidrug/hemolysin transport system ATP-binding protein